MGTRDRSISITLKQNKNTMNAQNEMKAVDWDNTLTTFNIGDRVLVHEDEGTLYVANVSGFADGLLHLKGPDLDAFEHPSICEVVPANYRGPNIKRHTLEEE